MEKRYVAYYRVSTKEQGTSHLGLDAQRHTVMQYIRNNGNKIIAEFTEVESGRNDNRPQLKQAIDLCKSEDATLCIAKLDRLSRSVWMIADMLMKTKVNFICCDMPFADKTTIFIVAALAQREVELISTRTKEALQAKFRREPEYKQRHGRKANGSINLTEEGRKKAHETSRSLALTDQSVRHAWHYIQPLRAKGISYGKIAEILNKEGYKTRRGKTFNAQQVINIYKRFTNLEDDGKESI